MSTGLADGSVVLADDRRLAFTVSGDPRGQGVVFLHGFNDSRLTRHPDLDLTRRLGVRLVTVDRPGYGRSDPLPGRLLSDWPADVAALADVLGMATFGVVGWSGGGPHALACGVALPDRVTRVALASPVGDPTWPDAAPARSVANRVMGRVVHSPRLLGAGLAALARMARSRPERFFERVVVGRLPPADRAVVELAGLRETMVASTAEAVRQGARGLVSDASVLTRPWALPSLRPSVPVAVWCGGADTVVPVGAGPALAGRIPGSELHELADEGHWLVFSHWEEIVGWAAARR